MAEQENNSNGKLYRCWIDNKEKILSFRYVEGYELIEFNSHSEFQDYYYRKTYWGYRVK